MDHGGRLEAPRPGASGFVGWGGPPAAFAAALETIQGKLPRLRSRTVPAGERARQLPLLLASAGLSGLGIVAWLSTLAQTCMLLAWMLPELTVLIRCVYVCAAVHTRAGPSWAVSL